MLRDCFTEIQFAADLCAAEIHVTAKLAIVKVEAPEFGKRAVDRAGELGVVQKAVLVDH
jgi:hypothetical protein